MYNVSQLWVITRPWEGIGRSKTGTEMVGGPCLGFLIQDRIYTPHKRSSAIISLFVPVLSHVRVDPGADWDLPESICALTVLSVHRYSVLAGFRVVCQLVLGDQVASVERASFQLTGQFWMILPALNKMVREAAGPDLVVLVKGALQKFVRVTVPFSIHFLCQLCSLSSSGGARTTGGSKSDGGRHL